LNSPDAVARLADERGVSSGRTVIVEGRAGARPVDLAADGHYGLDATLRGTRGLECAEQHQWELAESLKAYALLLGSVGIWRSRRVSTSARASLTIIAHSS
jgi:hypothetical protein